MPLTVLDFRPRAHSNRDDEPRLRFALHRYLGWPGQAPPYKLGERIWLQAGQVAATRQQPDQPAR